MLCIRGTSHGPVSVSVCPSQVGSSTKTAKCRITQTKPHDSPGSLVFWCQWSPRTSSFCTVAWQLARFQLTRRIARSLDDSWASCFCSRDKPTKEEKMDMAQSIINTFPVLKDPRTGGYVSSFVSLSTKMLNLFRWICNSEVTVCLCLKFILYFLQPCNRCCILWAVNDADSRFRAMGTNFILCY